MWFHHDPRKTRGSCNHPTYKIGPGTWIKVIEKIQFSEDQRIERFLQPNSLPIVNGSKKGCSDYTNIITLPRIQL